MANMSYCRFENTANDLEDCVESLQNGEQSSVSEWHQFQRMLELAETLLEFNEISKEAFTEEEEE